MLALGRDLGRTAGVWRPNGEQEAARGDGDSGLVLGGPSGLSLGLLRLFNPSGAPLPLHFPLSCSY